MPWEYDPNHSVITFENTYLGILTIKGRFKSAEVSLELDEDDPSHSSAVATIDAASIETDILRRDDTLRSAGYLDVERFPTIGFTSRRVERRGDRYAIIGHLTIHGITREVEMDTVFNGDAMDARGIVRRGFSANVSISRSDYDIHTRAVEPVPVAGEEVRISLEVAAIKRG